MVSCHFISKCCVDLQKKEEHRWCILCCKDLENRTSLISQIGDLCQTGLSESAFLVECLITFWEDSTCNNISCCMLNKAVLFVASKYLESDISSCLNHYLELGIKANMWCRKHLCAKSISTKDATDLDHSKQFFQLILDALSFSSIILSALVQSPIFGDEMEMAGVRSFIFELLKLTKASVCDVKKFQSHSSETLKLAQVVLDSTVKFCRAYYQSVNKKPKETLNVRKESQKDSVVDYYTHIMSITATAIETLYELGIFAASGGGNLVSMLNVTWKGVVFLLQLDKAVLAEKVNIGDIILTLISLAMESLRTASATWAAMKEALTVSEAKRAFLPVKFYLINAVRISSEFPCTAVNIYKEISRCVLLISSLGVSLSKEINLKAASESLVEFLEPTSFLLMHTLLTSSEINFECKKQILDWLFAFTMESCPMEIDADSHTNTLTNIFSIDCADMPNSELLMVGRVVLFVNLLKSSSSLKDEMICEISKKLGIFINALMHENVYSSILSSPLPVLCASRSPGITWASMFSCVLDSLKTYLIVASSNGTAWIEAEMFLFDNLFHSHFLCLHIIRELWYFYTRHAEIEVIHYILDRLCQLFKLMASSELKMSSLSPFRKMAKSICYVLTGMSSSFVDQVYNSITRDGNSYLPSFLLVALLLEGFPLASLSSNLKKVAVQKIVNEFYDFVENNFKEVRLNDAAFSSDLIGLPVLALSSALRSCKMKSSDIVEDKDISKILKFSVALIHGFRNAADGIKDHYLKILTATLDIISTLKHLHISNELKSLILELQALFVSDSGSSLIYQCKPSLVSFMVSPSNLEISESSDLYSAILSLYHVLLKEKHWAFNHLAISAFATFAACTSCTELWRFIPDDAALSFDILTGKEANESNFMAEFKAYLEKEPALNEITFCKDLLLEGIELKKLSAAQNNIADKSEGIELKKLNATQNDVGEKSEAENMEIRNKDCGNKKKRRLPDEFCQGVELLQNGLDAMNNAITKTDSDEIRNLLSSHTSQLKDVISRIVRISDNV